MIAAGALVASGCKKGKNAQATVEEVPAATATTDSATALNEEPSLAKVKGKEPPPAAVHPAQAFSPKGKYVVQVAVFKSRKQANQAKQKLVDAGYPAYVASVESPTPEMPGMHYRVRIGNFDTPKDAHEFGKSLRSQGYSYWADRKSHDHLGGGEPSGAATQNFSSPSPRHSSPTPEPSYSAPASSTPSAPSAPVSEPVGVPEPPAPSEPAPSSDNSNNNSWGNPVSDTASKGASAPAAHKDTTGGAVEGW